MLESMARARRYHQDVGMVRMKVDEESRIGKARVETGHRFQAIVAQSRKPLANVLPIHFIDLGQRYLSVHSICGRLNFTLLRRDLYSAMHVIHGGKAVDEIIMV